VTDPVRVSIYIDPSCPWTWNTAAWLREVAPQRGLLLRWRSLSLVQRDGGELPPSMPEQIRVLASAARIQSHRLLRVFEALRAQSREDDIGGLYQMWGEWLFGGPARTGPPEPPAPELVAELAAAAGLPDEFAAAADDESWDAALSDSLDAARRACGPHPLSPTLVLDDESLTGLSGPVFSPAPTGEAALRAWDAVRVLLAEPGFFELRRARTGPPAFAAG
jgi:Mycothiol-dependent nitroreductase Rv2466c